MNNSQLEPTSRNLQEKQISKQYGTIKEGSDGRSSGTLNKSLTLNSLKARLRVNLNLSTTNSQQEANTATS